MSHFTIKSIVSKETYKEIKWHLISKSDKIHLAIMLFGALMLIIMGVVSGKFIISAAAVVVTAAFLFAWYRNMKKAVKLQFQRINESTGADELELEISFNDDKITIFCTRTNGTSFIDYINLNRFVKTKNMYVLFTKAKQFIVIDKAALAEKGMRKEFLRFIRSKMEE